MATQSSTQTYSGILTRGTENAVNNTNVEEGKLRVATDSKRLFFDLNNSRLEITDIVRDYTEAQLNLGSVGETPILNATNMRKLFVASDTGKVFICDTTGAENVLVPHTSFKVDSATNADSATQATSATYASSASSADSAVTATSATYATSAGSAGSATSATSATYATSAGSASSATNASTATYAESAGSADSATSATQATSATYATSAGSASSATSSTNATSATYASSATADASGNILSTAYAKLDSPVFTGTPESVTPTTSDNSTKIATTEFVNAAITAAIGSIGGISIVIPPDGVLPDVGQPGTFYLIRNASQTGTNLYDEYIWIPTTSSYESLGPIEIDLTGYINHVASTGTGNAVTGFAVSGTTMTLEKNSTFLTEHPDISINANTTSEASPTAGGTFTAIDSVTKDSNGHVTSYNTKTVTLPNMVSSATYATSAGSATSATNASTATYAENAGSATSATNASTATYATSAGSADSATSATSATYATSAGSATSATNASTATYAESAGSADSATSATSATYATAAGSATSATSATDAVNATSAAYATSASSADSATSATSATYATSAGSADSATSATSATYATSADSAVSATSASYASSADYTNDASYIVTGSTANRIPYYGCGATTASAASTATADCFNFDFGDIDSKDYYF